MHILSLCKSIFPQLSAILTEKIRHCYYNVAKRDMSALLHEGEENVTFPK